MRDVRFSQGHAAAARFDFSDALFLLLLLLSSFQFLKIGSAQLGQLFGVMLLPVLAVRREIRVTAWEAWAFALFISVALSITLLSDYQRIKAAEQIVKFTVLMPGFYVLGRHFGVRARTRRLPFGYIALAGFLVFEFALQYFEVPVLHEKVDFMQGALYGSFKERNWLAAFFFMASYICFLQSPKRVADIVKFVALAMVVTILSQSKTVLVSCAIALLFQVRGYVFAKILTMFAGAGVYFYLFTRALSGDQLQTRLEEERGLAFMQSIKLVANDWVGHGFGFVEHYFGHSAISVIGLGQGTSAVFCAPLDLALIAGPVGVFAWAVFFGGLGLGRRAASMMAPIAAWSLVNPMHQGEGCYLFLGFIASFAALPVRQRSRLAYAPIHHSPFRVRSR
jgi:hypothetical protein